MTETILITGNGGFIGSYIEKTLSDRYNTVGLSRAEGYDITDFNSLKKIETKIDIIIHAAAIASDDYETSFQTNVVGTLNLCKYAKENGIKRFILLSSIFAFDENDNGYFNSYGKTKKISEEVFNQIETFARYGFNKAHSTCYAFIAYQTAWLKHYYPKEFIAALMSSEINDSDRIYIFLEECRKRGTEVLPPNVNFSNTDFIRLSILSSFEMSNWK